MPSVRETSLNALFERVDTIDGPDVKRNGIYPNQVPSNGLVNVEDGEPGEPETSLSPTTYHYEHRAEIVCLVRKAKSEDRDAMMDEILESIGDVLEEDRTLGGAVEHLEIEAPVTEGLPTEGAEGVKGAVVPVILYFSTERPI